MKRLFKTIVTVIITFEARVLLKRKQPLIVAVTGSVGKTSTKDAIYAVIKDHVSARKNQKSLNTEIGAPLTVLGLQNAWFSPWGWLRNIAEGFYIAFFTKDYPEVLILEAGINQPGDMRQLTSWLKPDVVVLTRLPDVPTHVEHFNSPEEVIEEKMELVKALKPEGVLIYNRDDEKVVEVTKDIRQPSFAYSRYSSSHFRAKEDKVVYDGSKPFGIEFSIKHLEETQKFRVKKTLGVQQAYNCAAAVAVGHQFGVTLSEAAKAIESYVPPAGRMRLIEGIEDSLVIDDSYNSSPVACERALQTLGEVKNCQRKIAVLGDMLELGQYSVREHEKMGELVAENADWLFTIGVRARKIAEKALENGMSEKKIRQYDDVNRAAEEIRDFAESGDVILVKASQGVRTEKVVKRLMRNPTESRKTLVRQGEMWLKTESK